MSQDFRKNSAFKWTKQKGDVALGLAEGKTQRVVATECGIDERTIRNWLQHPDFSAEVDRLTFMTGIAIKAERLRIVKRMVKQRIDEEGHILTEKDILDWLKFAQSETDGIKLDLTAVLEAYNQLAGGGQTGTAGKD